MLNPEQRQACTRRYLSNCSAPVAQQLSLAFFAQKRSGHHAIINWILRNLDSEGLFLNNCRPGISPLLGRSRVDSVSFDREGHCVSLPGQMPAQRPTGCLAYNFEGPELSKAGNWHNLFQRIHHHGKSERHFDILVLRDPFNQLASRLQWARSDNEPIDLPAIRNRWIQYAREYLHETGFLPGKLLVNYNRWFSASSYRERLARELNLPSADRGVNEVAKWGPNSWGASFDNLKYDGRAGEMRVMERWQRFQDDEEWLSAAAHPQLIALAERIFGQFQPIRECLNVLARRC